LALGKDPGRRITGAIGNGPGAFIYNCQGTVVLHVEFWN
jgi:hypothetical protein